MTYFKTSASQVLPVRLEIEDIFFGFLEIFANSLEEINIAQISCLLDPRYKLLNFEYSDNIKKKYKKKCDLRY